MRSIPEPKGLPLRLPFAPDKNYNHVCDIRIPNVSSDVYISRAEVELTEDNFPFDKALPDGTDIAFRDDKGVTLNHSVVNWGNGSAKVNVVLKDNVDYRGLRSLQMFYGKLPFPIPSPAPPPLRWTYVTRVAQLGYNKNITTLLVFNNKLYGTTYDGMLLEWNGSNAWIEKANSDIWILASTIYKNKLYGGGTDHKILEWNGVDAWSTAGQCLTFPNTVNSLCGFDNALYASNGKRYVTGGIVEWVDDYYWTARDSIDERWSKFDCLLLYGGNLYGLGGTYGKLYKWYGYDFNGNKVLEGRATGESDAYHMIVFRNRIYMIARYHSKLYQWDGASSWIGPKAQMASNTESLDGAVVVYNDELLVTSNWGGLWAWNNLNAWISVSNSPSLSSLCVYDGRLFGGGDRGSLVEFVAT